MKHLGKYLLENAIVSEEQLEEALQSQVAFGGRLGTNLVELGYLTLDELTRHLAAHVGLSVPPREWLETPEITALQAVPVELVKRHKVLPLKIENRTLHLAMVDPLDPARMDEIAFASGLRVKPYVFPEATAYYWLDYHYDIPREIRHIDLGGAQDAKLDPEDEAWARRHRAAQPAPLAPEAQALGIAPLGEDEELVGETVFSELQTRMIGRMDAARDEMEHREAARSTPAAPRPEAEAESMPAPAPEAADTRIPALEAALRQSTNRAEVADRTLRLAGRYAESAALLLVRPQTIEGLQALGEMSTRVRGVVLPRASESRFAACADDGEPLRMAVPTTGIDARVLAALGRSAAREMALLPVRIRARVVNLLYVDNGPDALGETAYAALEALCREMSGVYERLILERKRRIG